MVKPEMIPDEVWMAARLELVDGPIREDMEDRYKHAIAAALNAWPGSGIAVEINPTMRPVNIILPLPLKEKENGRD